MTDALPPPPPASPPGPPAASAPLPPPPPPGPAPAPTIVVSRPLMPSVSGLWWVAGPLAAVMVIAISFLLARPAPYIAISPGSARSVEPLVTISAKPGEDVPDIDKASNADAGLLFVTVSVRQPSGIETLARLLSDTNDVVPAKVVRGDQSAEENRSFNLQLMTDSKDKATKVALERAGYTVKVTATGAVVIDLDPDKPVAAVVAPGDTIVGADGSEVASVADLVGVIATHQPGESIDLDVLSFGAASARPVRVKLGTNAETGKAQLGVSLQDRPSYTFPVKVDIDSGQVGGPSAGLAFTLAILDQLTTGDLTGPDKVAVTGTIELDGSVGPVGGVKQKTEAAISAGAKVFLVPPDEFADATSAARGRLKVMQVSTLDEAIAALATVGGAPIPAVPDAPATGSGG